MTFLEKDLEDIIYNTNNQTLNLVGLPIRGKKLRQVRIGNYGIADLITIERQSYLERVVVTVYELKKDNIDINSFLQAVRYARGIQSWFPNNKKYDLKISLCIIGKSVSVESDFIYLPSILPNLNMFTYSYDFDGIKFNEVGGYKLIKEGL